MIRSVFFDLDGTLLPMNQEMFVKGYMLSISKAVAHLGITTDMMCKALMDGVKAMVMNDGTVTNDVRFWNLFEELTGVKRSQAEPVCDQYYSTVFDEVRPLTGSNPLAVTAIKNAHLKGRNVVLATNPLFPFEGQKTRMSWIGLSHSDFDLVTDYKTDRWCKPNPTYYTSICERLHLNPEEVLMIGNDEREDMAAASSVGMSCWLVTDCMIPSEKHPWAGTRGTFSEMTEMLAKL